MKFEMFTFFIIINIKVQSRFSQKEFVNPMVNPWLIRLPPTSAG